MAVHERGLLHRAFSIFVFDDAGRLMLQRRAPGKYHSSGLWTNTCCGHPRVGEDTQAAAHRRLREEMGFDCRLREVTTILHQGRVSDDLIEHEYDHIFVGLYNGEPLLNAAEASEWMWIGLPALNDRVNCHPDDFTIWFKIILEKFGSAEIERWRRTLRIRRNRLFQNPAVSYNNFLSDKWRTISASLGVDGPQSEAVLTQLLDAVDSWEDRLVGQQPPYRSYVAEDGFPAEFSVSWRDRAPEIRILFESLGSDATAHSAQEAGRQLTRRLASQPGVSIDRYLLVEDLFVSSAPAAGRPTIWHSLAWRPGAPACFKVYLNPQVHGNGTEGDVVAQAIERLGLESAWREVAGSYAELRERGHVLEFFALDLTTEQHARVKLYFRHAPMTFAELNRVASFARHHDSHKAAEVARLIYGDKILSDGGLISNEPITCLALRHGSTRADEANVYLRLSATADSDAEAARRIGHILEAEGVDPRSHARLLSALSPFDTAITSGIQELVSFRTTASTKSADAGVYFRFNVYGSE